MSHSLVFGFSGWIHRANGFASTVPFNQYAQHIDIEAFIVLAVRSAWRETVKTLSNRQFHDESMGERDPE